MSPESQTQEDKVRGVASRVLRTEALALQALAENPPAGFASAVALMLRTRGRIVVSGMGKSGHVGRKIAATLASTGTPALFLHPAEASHGDLGMLTPDDACLLLSNSGETRELSDLIHYSRRFEIPIVSITRASDSTLARQSTIALILPDLPEACAIGRAPTTSTTCTLALGDALAIALMEDRGFSADAFHVFHPGGKLGAQFLRVRDLMHYGIDIPVIGPLESMGEALMVMTGKGFGIAAVVEENILKGVITDGDLRRNLDGLLDRKAGDVSTTNPRTIAPDLLVTEALGIMNRYKISALFVVDADGHLCGLLHIHDCLRAGFI
jgi:arabinose-5-phosphate isomerase